MESQFRQHEVEFAVPKQRKAILVNRIQCNSCNDIIESKHRHDFVQCGCERVFVDGGVDYLRRGYKLAGDYTELSEHSFEDEDE